jgi:hypothetical protein
MPTSIPSTLASPPRPRDNQQTATFPELAARFRTELPTLLRDHPGQWVAYTIHGERILRGDQRSTYHELMTKRGLGHDEFVIAKVMPQPSDEVERLHDES